MTVFHRNEKKEPLPDALRGGVVAIGNFDGVHRGHQAVLRRALERLDALLPTSDPMGTLLEWLAELRTEEIDFLEGGSEIIEVSGFAVTRSAPRGAAWAASLAAAMRPHLFGLGSAPMALAGVMPRAVFRELHEEPLPVVLRAALQVASEKAEVDLRFLRRAVVRADEVLSGLYASSTAPQTWRMIVSLSCAKGFIGLSITAIISMPITTPTAAPRPTKV